MKFCDPESLFFCDKLIQECASRWSCGYTSAAEELRFEANASRFLMVWCEKCSGVLGHLWQHTGLATVATCQIGHSPLER